jgi:MinD-like ATPase involved in chromosome partitioning or flagellar assembly
MAGPTLLEWRKLHRDDVRRAIELLARNYDTVVLDTCGTLNELTEMAVEVATIVLWVTTTEYASVKDSLEALRILRMLSFNPERIRVVMNAVSADEGVAPSLVEEALQRDIFWTVPYDKKVRQSAHLGQPAVLTAPNSAAARSLAGLATVIAGGGRVKPAKTPAFAWRPANGHHA